MKNQVFVSNLHFERFYCGMGAIRRAYGEVSPGDLVSSDNRDD